MFGPIVDFFEKLISEFSWRRLLFILAVLGIVAGGFVVYETYTKTFKLARLEKEVSLLERLADLSKVPAVQTDGELSRIYSALSATLEDEVSRTVENNIVPVWFKKAGAALIPWLLLALVIALTQRSKNEQFDVNTALGMFVMATPFVILAIFLPTFSPAWINYLLYPIGHVAFVVVLALAWHNSKKRRIA